MLDFPENFFNSEERDGFLVDATMKTVWAAELEVLNEIAVICNRHGLTWFAAYGTLLGTIRHAGYVPWDDDMDIMMLRDDYMKLVEVLPKELPEGYVVKCPMYEEGHTEYHVCVQNSDSISIEPGHLEKFHGCPFIVGVDIFPLDHIPRDPEKRSYLRNMFLLARQTIWKLDNNAGEADEIEKALSTLEQQCKVVLKRPVDQDSGEDLEKQLRKLCNRIAMACGSRDGDYVTSYHTYIKDETAFFDKKCFGTVQWMPFEQIMMPVPLDYDAILTKIYGDYHVKINNSAAHDYPYYQKQLEELRERFKESQSP